MNVDLWELLANIYVLRVFLCYAFFFGQSESKVT